MRSRSLWVCVAIVLSAHGAMAWTAWRGAASGDSSAPARANPAIRWIRLAAAPDPGQALRPGGAATTQAAVASAARSDASAPPHPGPGPVEAFLPPSDLEVAARPRSAPDTALLEGLQWSGLPMRLRLFVDATGTVVDVVVLQSRDADDVVQRVRRMFLSTGFIPARAGGRDVSSYKDLEIAVGDGMTHRAAQGIASAR